MAAPYALTADGFESQIGTNHLGHFALTNLLLPKLSDRAVTVSSMAHWPGRINLADLNWKNRRYAPWLAYSQSKLANLLFTHELQRRLAAAASPLRALAAHPGYSHTNLQGAPGRNWETPSFQQPPRWSGPTPTSEPGRRCLRPPRICPATFLSGPDSATSGGPNPSDAAGGRKTRRLPPRCGTYRSSSPAPNFRLAPRMR
jgi:NAD(P)-dependent dehydrogenase (short-subunit alcohol dehydrogenase family)